jgi:hypothetical protein
VLRTEKFNSLAPEPKVVARIGKRCVLNFKCPHALQGLLLLARCNDALERRPEFIRTKSFAYPEDGTFTTAGRVTGRAHEVSFYPMPTISRPKGPGRD